MKWNITDLLDDYQEDALLREEDTPLSMERIAQRTMDVVVPPKKHPFRRTVPGILVAAMIATMLAVTAIAEERTLLVSDWFRTALNQQAEEDAQVAQNLDLQGVWKNTIGESSLAALNDHGRIVNQSITDNGTTITLAALYGDEYVLNLYFQVIAPPGTQLPDHQNYYFGNGVHMTGSGTPQGVVLVPEGYMISENYGLRLNALPDADPADNRKDFLLSLHHSQKEQRINGVPQKRWSFSDDVPKTIAVEGLYVRDKNDSYDAVLLGSFTFDITNTHDVVRREIPLSGCGYSGQLGDMDYTVDPINMSLSPFTVEIVHWFTCTKENHSVIMDFQVVLKDGTTRRQWETVYTESEDGLMEAVLVFTNPINPAQIDYILIGNPNSQGELHKVYP